MLNSASSGVDDVVIVGGGIGGLAAALALRRNGLAVRVLERAPEFSEVGAGIQLAPNATRLIRSWGQLDEVLAVGIRPKRLVLSDAFTGADLTALDLGQEFAERYGAPYVVLHRTDLLDVLLRACLAAGVELENDKTVTSVSSDSQVAAIEVADGSEYSAHLVVAADGLHSTLRRYLVDDEPIASGFVAFRGAVPLADVKRHASLEEVQVYVGPGIHLVQYPVRSGSMYNQVAVFRSQRYLDGEIEWGTAAELYSAFDRTCPAVQESVDSLWSDQRWPMYDRAPVQSWVAGRLVLLGDAAHPMLQYLAQGACQAFEDAAVLSESLRTFTRGGLADGERLSRALADYVGHRQPRTARAQRNARNWGDIWHTDGIGVMLRNEIFTRRESTDFRYTDWLFENPPGLGGLAADQAADTPGGRPSALETAAGGPPTSEPVR